MAHAHSPLRYPGGKQILARVLAHLIHLNGARGGIYAEPYAGGAGASLALLFGEHVDRILINDADPSIYAFWHGILHDTDRFLRLLRDTPVTLEEWARQRQTYQHPKRHSALRVGFATFFLNRCNRSGIIPNGGPIGGQHQSGIWKLDVRFTRAELIRRISRIALYRDRISISNLDAIKFLKRHVESRDDLRGMFVYLDPPYYAQGQKLYLNYYKPPDHASLAAYLVKAKFLWVMSYDNVPEITTLYVRLRQVPFDLSYCARERRIGKEIMILKRGLEFPTEWLGGIPAQYISAADRIDASA